MVKWIPMFLASKALELTHGRLLRLLQASQLSHSVLTQGDLTVFCSQTACFVIPADFSTSPLQSPLSAQLGRVHLPSCANPGF